MWQQCDELRASATKWQNRATYLHKGRKFNNQASGFLALLLSNKTTLPGWNRLTRSSTNTYNPVDYCNYLAVTRFQMTSAKEEKCCA
jgi:hypothetical protein